MLYRYNSRFYGPSPGELVLDSDCFFQYDDALLKKKKEK